MNTPLPPTTGLNIANLIQNVMQGGQPNGGGMQLGDFFNGNIQNIIDQLGMPEHKGNSPTTGACGVWCVVCCVKCNV
jgi:hypothetical protein